MAANILILVIAIVIASLIFQKVELTVQETLNFYGKHHEIVWVK